MSNFRSSFIIILDSHPKVGITIQEVGLKNINNQETLKYKFELN